MHISGLLNSTDRPSDAHFSLEQNEGDKNKRRKRNDNTHKLNLIPSLHSLAARFIRCNQSSTKYEEPAKEFLWKEFLSCHPETDKIPGKRLLIYKKIATYMTLAFLSIFFAIKITMNANSSTKSVVKSLDSIIGVRVWALNGS